MRLIDSGPIATHKRRIEMKTRTCKRCNGTGMRNTPVAHLGVPGLCYGCNGSGVQGWVDATVITAELQRAHDRHIAEIRQIITDCETGFARGTIGERQYTQWTTQRKNQLVAMGTIGRIATKGEWRPAARQTEKAGV